MEPSAADSLDAKAAGNAAFSAGDHLLAVEKYTAAIAWEPDNAVLHSNRAAALLGLRGGAGASLMLRGPSGQGESLVPPYTRGGVSLSLHMMLATS